MIDRTSESTLTFRRMTSGDRREAFELMRELYVNDPYYRDSSAAYGDPQAGAPATEAKLGEALTLYVDRPDYGFVWMAFEAGRAVGCAAVGYGISAALGTVVANVDSVVVAPERRRSGIGFELIESLAHELRAMEIARMDATVHVANAAARAFYEELGFLPAREERYALVL